MPGPARILLIDDQPKTLALLSRMLLSHLPDAEVLTARSGAEGIAMAEQRSLDLILLDAKMPGLDGFATCRRLKQNPHTRVVPVLMVSGALTDPRDRVAGMEVGADGYLCKPFEPEELVAQARALLRIKAAEDGLREREQLLEQQLEARTQILRESEMRFRILFENSPDAIFVESEEGVVLDANAAAAALHGLSRGELVGGSVFDLIPMEHRARAKELYGRWFDGRLRRQEGFSQRVDGAVIPVEILASCVRYAGQNAVLLHVRDITSRRAAEQALRDSEARFRGMVEDLSDLVCRRDPDGVILFANPAFGQFVDREPASLVGQSSLQSLPEGERTRVRRHLRSLTPAQPVSRIEHLMRAGDGRLHWVQWIDRGIFDAAGNLVELQSAGRDVTEQKRAQEEQSRSSLYLRAVLDIADELIASSDIDTLCRRAVELARSHLGLDRCRLMLEQDGCAVGTYGTNLRAEITDEHALRLPLDDEWRARLRLRGPEEPRWWEERTRYMEWDGRALRPLDREGPVACTPVQTPRTRVGVLFNDNAHSGAPLDLAKQDIVAVFCSLVAHIAERKGAEAEHARLTVAVEQSAECVMVLSPGRIIQYVNPAFTRIFGYKRDEAIGRLSDLLRGSQHDEDFFAAIWRQVLAGEPWSGRVVERRKNGEEVATDQTISPVRGPSGRIIQVLALIQDVTRSVQMENELRQAQKMETVGRLAGGIAHDFNNLLTGILGFGRLLEGELGAQHPLHGDVMEILSAGERAASLTSRLLAFSHKHLAQLRPMDLGAAVLSMDQILRRTLGEDVELVTTLGQNLGAIEADDSLIELIVMNLAVNARDAMPGGGKLCIAASAVVLDEEWCNQRAGVKPGPYVLLTVRDTGTGMSPDALAHVFEPFFTTKEKGKGSGLGLSTVYAIVRQLKGHIELTSVPGEGTEFRIYFPRTSEMTPGLPARASAAPVVGGHETILVVEDEATVRHLALRYLESLGYRVTAALNGQDALRLAEELGGELDAVLTDVIMPVMGGMELAQRLRERSPALPILYMSGFTDEIPGGPGGSIAGPLLRKPFTLEALAEALRKVLDLPRS